MNSDAIAKLRELLEDARISMITTIDAEGELRSRPMALQESDFDGDLWFFTSTSSTLVDELNRNATANVSFAKNDNVYVSVSGRAQCVSDAAKAKQLWNEFYRTWFPEGLDDPNLQLVKLEVTKAEYWDSPGGAVMMIWGAVKATLTGKEVKAGEHGKL